MERCSSNSKILGPKDCAQLTVALIDKTLMFERSCHVGRGWFELAGEHLGEVGGLQGEGHVSS